MARKPRNKNILIIEQGSYIRYLINHDLPDDYFLFTVQTLSAAFELAQSQKFDLIIQHVENDENKGVDVCEELKGRNETKYTPLLIISPYERKEEIISGLHAGAEDYMTTPIIPSELLARIDAHLRTREYYLELQKEDLLMLLQLTEIISVTRNPKKILYIIVEMIFEVIEVSRCSIIGIDDDGQLTVKASNDLPPGDEIILDLDKYPEIEKALTTQRPVVIEDALHDPIMAPVRDNLVNLENHAIYVVPIVKKQNVIGTFFLRTTAESKGALSGRVYKLCQIISNIAGNALENAVLFEAMSTTKKLLEDMSVRDSLTQLYNHQYLHARLEEEFFRAQRYEHPLSCIFIDMDNFKTINDTYGHLVGDVVLKQIARMLKDFVRKSDIAARYGGEEFVMVLPNAGCTGASNFAERLLQKICALKIDQLKGQSISASIGVATLKENNYKTFQNLLQAADDAMYEAKKKGKKQVCAACAEPKE